jgi:hypothetical protein
VSSGATDLESRIRTKAANNATLRKRWSGDWSGLSDSSSSGKAFALGAAMKRAGFSFEEMAAAIRRHPDTAEWAATKGDANSGREMWRVWKNADSQHQTQPQSDAQLQNNAINAVVAELNQRFMVINEAGRVIIYAPAYDPILKRKRFDRLTFEDLNRLYLNRPILVGTDDKERPIYKTASRIWLQHPDRRQFVGGLTFDPANRISDPTVLNLWNGFATEPKAGDWSLLCSHIHSVICGGDQTHYDYLMCWLARMVQHPAELGEVAVVLKGGEGPGKGTLAKVMLRILGQHGMHVSNSKHLVGNFNGHLRDAVFLFCDEAFFAGDKQHVGVLKSLITEPFLTVEAKFQNAVQTPNFLHILMASNEDWVVPASLDARRFLVLEVSDAAKGNHEYFAEIWKQMEDGGYAAMLYDLLHMNLSSFNVRAVPVTAALQDQRKLSLPVPEAWWRDCLERGYVFPHPSIR